MTRPRSLDFTPISMPAPQAAHYIGVSESTLRKLPIDRRILGAKRLYLRADLDAFVYSLPTEAGESEANTCDEVFT